MPSPFPRRMLLQWTAYRYTVELYEKGEVSVAWFLEAHAAWNREVEAFEREHSPTTNFGAF